MLKLFRNSNHLKHMIRQFTPNWFTVTMGTGVVALLLAELSEFSSWMWQLGAGLWHFNSLLFVLFSVLYTLRWILFPQEAKQIFKHPTMSLFLGAIPMGLATIINGALQFGISCYGDSAVQVAEWLWYVDVVLAVLIAWIVPFCMYSIQQHELKAMTAVWLLPIVACEVAASSGGLLLQYLEMNQHAVTILLTSYVLWGISVLPAFAILSILMLRLAMHQLPVKEMAMSSWLALGPIGTGALALMLLGQQAPHVLAVIQLQQMGEFFQYAGILGSLILLGFGVWWLGIATLTTIRYLQTGLAFNLGWWALTFPLGVFSFAVLKTGAQMQMQSITLIGTALVTCLIVLWLLVMAKTMQGFYTGTLFFSPCLKSYLELKQ